MRLTKSEKKILAKIKNTISYTLGKKYMFWFIYDKDGTSDDVAVDWEGGYDLSLSEKFRNQYTLEQGKRIKKNWDG